MTAVRIASPADEPEIIRLLHMMHAEGGMFPLDLECARETFAKAFERRGGIIGVIGTSNNIRAMIYLMIARQWYTIEHHLEEIFNYVRPDSRHSNHAAELIGFARNQSDALEVPLVIGVLTNKRMEAKVRLYRRVLGTPAGAFFVHGAKWVNGAGDLSNEDFWRSPFPAKGKREKTAA